MIIKDIIDAERISLEKVKARYGSIAYEVTGMLNRIEEKASNLLYPSVRKIWIDNEGSIRIDFFGNWHIAVQEGALYDLIEDAKAPLLKRIAELEEVLSDIIFGTPIDDCNRDDDGFNAFPRNMDQRVERAKSILKKEGGK